MEQRLRLVPTSGRGYEKRVTDRLMLSVPGQIIWKDAKGATRMTPVTTRDVSEHGVNVECKGGTAIPLYRLVYFQIDREARHRPDLPAVLRRSNVLSAVFRVGPCSDVTGAPTEYALRLLVEPKVQAGEAPVTWQSETSQTRTA
jgi:hypothetical protein